MRLVVQRVSEAKVSVDNKTIGQIDHGFLVLLGITHNDTKEQVIKLVDKLAKLRIFEDQDGKMNNNIIQSAGNILVVSQFTLYADCKKGNRPSFIDAARPEVAEPLYDYFVKKIDELGVKVSAGKFGAYMQVSLINDGPVTLVLES
ncbi:MAG: D-tyrosyl-tRNA(Tyr) deacylase [Candidatus Magasanikbacteria bacterium CG_4_10_14_0_2_um_filter_37_12]|uniref:D-aminoacyl-tRNA deacylase n=1 Tax=Candidatus Magasanikbacteria bacterium CG_4_10_14_0_2_um_filter_37_12 TaxID=1974637 RepID=A0A2M7V895_9BACT|nr:MAG: D-tyrosyl-tRNA(Tyr) deacylase [Candidatus Magasanikbacteria bacterium CG_4_10_14_0_2_um_filter_37_12]